jgi:hypothetical protein
VDTITAKVSENILRHAASFFTGSASGRILELLQNSRRAGATRIDIKTQDVGYGTEVTFEDNGSGINDFEKLLDLGATGWTSEIKESEDPAGLGLFSLAPRAVIVHSLSKMLCIEGSGWYGEPVSIRDAPPRVGTLVKYVDEQWSADRFSAGYELKRTLERHAKFSGMHIYQNDKLLGVPVDFIPPELTATEYPELGCRIVVDKTEVLSLNETEGYGSPKACRALNFHGHLINLESAYVPNMPEHSVRVDMTGAPTPLRFMLPARTQLVGNNGKRELDKAIRLELYKFVQRVGKHSLPYVFYEEAKTLGVVLPESEPVYIHAPSLGNRGNTEAPFGVTRKALRHCYRFPADLTITVGDADEEDADNYETAGSDVYDAIVNAILEVEDDLHYAEVPQDYSAYSWANGHKGVVESIHISTHKELTTASWLDATIRVYEKITARTLVREANGSPMVFETNLHVCFGDSDDEVLLSLDGLREKHENLFWFSGGYCDEGDWEAQNEEFYDIVQSMDDDLKGKYETLRRHIVTAVRKWLRDAKRITVEGEYVKLEYDDDRNGTKIIEVWPGRDKVTE